MAAVNQTEEHKFAILQNTHIKGKIKTNQISNDVYLTTHPPSYLAAYPPTHLPTYLPTYLPTHPPT